MAKLQWTRVANRDPQKTYNPKNLAQLAKDAPAIDWYGYFTEAGLTSALPTLVIRQPDYLQGLSALIESTPTATWSSYFRFRILSSRAPFLPRAFVEEDFAFNQGCSARGRSKLRIAGSVGRSWSTGWSARPRENCTWRSTSLRHQSAHR